MSCRQKVKRSPHLTQTLTEIRPEYVHYRTPTRQEQCEQTGGIREVNGEKTGRNRKLIGRFQVFNVDY